MLCFQLKTTFFVSFYLSEGLFCLFLQEDIWLLSIFKFKINQINSIQWPSFIHKPFSQLLHLRSIQNVKQLSHLQNYFIRNQYPDTLQEKKNTA